MSLEDQIKKEEEELKKLEAGEQTDDKPEDDEPEGDEDQEDGADDEEDQDDEEGSDDEDADDKDEGDEDEEGSDDEDADDKDKDDDKAVNKNDAAAKARIERKKRLKIEAELAELREKMQQGREAQNEPGKQKADDDKPETEAEKIARLEAAEEERQSEKLRNQAAEELSALEDEFAQDNPDYKDASTHMIKSMYQAALHFNPGISQKQAIAAVQNKVLQIASMAAKRGQNPAEVLYQMSFDTYGFEPGQAKPGKKTNAAESLKKKAKNKKRTANGLSGGGQTAGARATIEEADNMSLADFGNMSEAEIDELIAQAGS